MEDERGHLGRPRVTQHGAAPTILSGAVVAISAIGRGLKSCLTYNNPAGQVGLLSCGKGKNAMHMRDAA